MQIQEIISKFQIPIKEILINDGLVANAAHLLANIGFENKKILLVSDQNIYPIAKKIITQINCESLILQNPKADEKTVLEIINTTANIDLIIAVGSGVINDLCKLASFRKKIPYIIFGTAPSMNGYASANASITVDSHRTSLPAHLPTAIYLDLDVLVNSPPRLIKSGIGDSLCFSTCQFDWLLSHLILGTYYDATPFDLLKPYYQKLFTSSDVISDKNFIKTLTETLIISGIGMYICKGSYPASQAEHLIAHYIEIKYPEITEKSYHGEQIAITTLTVSEIQERILRNPKLQVKSTKINQNYLQKIFDEKLANHFFSEIQKKFIDDKKALEINQNLDKHWPEMQKQLQLIHISKNDLTKFSEKFALHKDSQDIEINNEIYNEAIKNAHLIRNRFTSLDIVN